MSFPLRPSFQFVKPGAPKVNNIKFFFEYIFRPVLMDVRETLAGCENDKEALRLRAYYDVWEWALVEMNRCMNIQLTIERDFATIFKNDIQLDCPTLAAVFEMTTSIMSESPRSSPRDPVPALSQHIVDLEAVTMINGRRKRTD